jgi:ubiquinone/menaquinone biosynthesis C-methylase UbiE
MGVAEYRQSALSAALDGNHPLHLLPSVPDDVTSVLDVGCHAGDILEALKLPRHRRQVGCDVNREALALAEKHLPHASFHLAGAESLPFDSGSFDMLFARGLISAIDIPKALREFNRVLKPGGKLCFDATEISERNKRRPFSAGEYGRRDLPPESVHGMIRQVS